MSMRETILMNRLLLSAVNDEPVVEATENYLNFVDVVAQEQGHTDLFRAEVAAREMLGKYCLTHSEGVFKVVSRFFGLSDAATIRGVRLTSWKLLYPASPAESH